jgi:hypothetical protein
MTTTKLPRRSHAEVVIDLLGGTQKVQEIVGIGRVQVWRWTASKEQGGTGGVIPQRHHRAILAYCRKNRIDVPAWLFLPDVDNDE